jgi:hypothetical protein
MSAIDREPAPTFANTGELLHHANGCRCWPHVSERDALDAIAAVALAEYRSKVAAPPAPLDVERLARAVHKLYPALRGLGSDNPAPCDHEPVYGSLTESGPGRTECQYDAGEIAREYEDGR